MINKQGDKVCWNKHRDPTIVSRFCKSFCRCVGEMLRPRSRRQQIARMIANASSATVSKAWEQPRGEGEEERQIKILRHWKRVENRDWIVVTNDAPMILFYLIRKLDGADYGELQCI